MNVLDISITEMTDSIIIQPENKLMLGYEANDFHEAVENALNNKKQIIIGLANVQFISSWGIGFLCIS